MGTHANRKRRRQGKAELRHLEEELTGFVAERDEMNLGYFGMVRYSQEAKDENRDDIIYTRMDIQGLRKALNRKGTFRLV